MIQSDDYDTTEFIKVPKNTNISISPRARLICLYTDKDSTTGDVEKYIKNTVYNHTINSGNNEYIRVAYYKSDADMMQIEISDSVTSYEPYGYDLKNINIPKKDLSNYMVNPLIGKTLLNFGDSIADGVSAGYKSYAHRIAEKNNMTIYDYANGGATIKVDSNSTNNILNQINNSSPVEADYVLFNGYTNDCKTVSNSTNEEYLGEITEGYDNSFNENTFCGAFEKILKTLHEKYVGAKIIYVGTHINYSRDLNSQRIFNDLALKICKKWGIAIANMFEEGGLNSFLDIHNQLYINDGSHPNSLGYDKYYVPIVESKMKNSNR
jgi:lysophospholipase L1-like esterase